MIISLNVENGNTYYKIFETIKKYKFSKLDGVNTKKVLSYKYYNEKIVACIIYVVRNNIFSLREYRQEIKYLNIIGFDKVLNYSTLSKINN